MLGALTLALVLGILWRWAAGLPAACVPGTRLAARTVLRAGIVLMGARLDFGLVAAAGKGVLALDVAMVVLGIGGVYWLTRRFGVAPRLGLLLAVGTGICGASAVVAAASVTRSDEDETALAVGLMGILGTIGVLLYVFAAPFLGLAPMQLAVLAGSTLHEVGQVMAAAFTWGTASGDLGTLVKLTRVVLLAPALVVLGWVVGGGAHRFSLKEPPVPWFVLGFLAVGIAGSLGLLPAPVRAASTTASVLLMATAMAAMGLNTRLELVARAGPRAIGAGLLGFGLMAVVSWALIRTTGLP